MTARERTPRPGATWERQTARGLEVVVDVDGGESPFGWTEPVVPRLNRAARRALAKAARRGRA